MPPKKNLQCFTKQKKDGSNYTTCVEDQDKKKKKKMKLRVVKKVEEPKPKKKKKLNIIKKVPKGKVLDNDETTLPYGDIPYAPLMNRKANGVYPSVYDLEPPEERAKWSYQEMPNPNKGGFREKDRYDKWKEDSDYLQTYTSRADYIRKDWERLRRNNQGRGGYDDYGRFSHPADDDDFWRYHDANPGAFD
jgi:hypothetical protein